MTSLKNKIGKVYLVGAGPGNPGLLTLRGQEVLKKADIVYYDFLANPILLQWVPHQATCIHVGKRYKAHHYTQSQIEAVLIKSAKKGLNVVRLKGGDPYLFGRGGEEALALERAKIPFEVVPGVSSALAVPAMAGIPLTHRALSSNLTIITGHLDPQKGGEGISWESVSKAETLVIMMGLHQLASNLESLIKAGKPKNSPAALVSWGTYPTQKIVSGTLATLAKKVELAKVVAPSLVVIGEVVKLKEKLYKLIDNNLINKRILIIKSRGLAINSEDQSNTFFLTQIVPEPASYKKLDQAFAHLTKGAWLVFTSQNGVQIFFDRLLKNRLDARSLNGVKIAVIGKKTAKKLLDYGLVADLIPKEWSSRGLIKAFGSIDLKGVKIIYPHSKIGRIDLVEGLKKQGAQIQAIAAYNTVIDPKAVRQFKLVIAQRGLPDGVVISSSSSANAFLKAISQSTIKDWKKVKIGVLGDQTAQTLKAQGFKADLIGKQESLEELALQLSIG